jgi:hypothetical protein
LHRIKCEQHVSEIVQSVDCAGLTCRDKPIHLPFVEMAEKWCPGPTCRLGTGRVIGWNPIGKELQHGT